MEEKIGDVKKERRKQIIQVIYLILLMSAIIGLFNAVITINKYKDLLQNPLGYNLDRFGLKYCTCYDSNQVPSYIKALSFNKTDEAIFPQIK